MFQSKNPTNKRIVKIPFPVRLAKSDQKIKIMYNEIKNEILSYGVHTRVSSRNESFRLHKVTFIKLKIVGNGIKLYFALDPKDYIHSTIPFTDASHIKFYKDVPLVFKLKSGLAFRRCVKLIEDVMKKNNLKKTEVPNIDWAQRIVDQVNKANIE